MYATDFEYDGQLLSSFGFIPCVFSASGGIETPESGFTLTFNKVKRHHGRKYGLSDVQYEECMTSTFNICKNPDLYDDAEISMDEYRALVRWLARSEFHKFRVLNDCGYDRQTCWFNASFNVKKMLLNDRMYGLELTVETDSPFGYGAPFDKTWSIANGGATVEFKDMSDDMEFMRPDVAITCGANGDLVVTNALTGSRMEIKNCVAGETIQIYGDTMIVLSSLASHRIYDDFNYDYLKIGNTYNDRVNRISVSMPCTFRLTYCPIIKDIV